MTNIVSLPSLYDIYDIYFLRDSVRDTYVTKIISQESTLTRDNPCSTSQRVITLYSNLLYLTYINYAPLILCLYCCEYPQQLFVL
jgi:hypothetical protein